ncbi:MAG: hypothetical protein RsTaC01_0725 [Candidatus Paraimprobicoccus trichonymphae]|uniref:VHS domain-containing protein n=1 Tax=Candidatus Paraimprobicoccus trichonymphae TaxID=3033793 RepID=A0AA48L007_9FIRM|nr:MAG: hypothetical protein RsTaC01_0725 [Candidatus Paraimprobicoccus trichonymphae]
MVKEAAYKIISDLNEVLKEQIPLLEKLGKSANDCKESIKGRLNKLTKSARSSKNNEIEIGSLNELDLLCMEVCGYTVKTIVKRNSGSKNLKNILAKVDADVKEVGKIFEKLT